MNENLRGVSDESVRKGITPPFFWIPGVVSVLFAGLLVLFKLLEKVPDGFLKWGSVVGYSIFFLLVSFGISVGIYFLVSMKPGVGGERQFNGRAFCEEKIRDEFKRKHNYTLDSFTRTGDSKSGVGWYPDGVGVPENRDMIFFELFRVRSQGGLSRYLLAVMNMEKGKEDSVIFEQATMNFGELNDFIYRNCCRLCRFSGQKTMVERVDTDFVSGRKSVTRKEEDRSPFDVVENGEEEEL